MLDGFGLTPAQQRDLTKQTQLAYEVSERRTCSVFCLARSTIRSNPTNDERPAMSSWAHPCPSGPTGPPGRRLGARRGGSPSIPVRSKRLELGFPAGGVTLVLGKLGGGAGRRSNGKCRLQNRQRISRCLRPTDHLSLLTSSPSPGERHPDGWPVAAARRRSHPRIPLGIGHSEHRNHTDEDLRWQSFARDGGVRGP